MNKEIKVLVIDDDEEDFIILRDTLSEIQQSRYVLQWSASYHDGLARIDEKQHDIYLVDYRLGAQNGLELDRKSTRLNSSH